MEIGLIALIAIGITVSVFVITTGVLLDKLRTEREKCVRREDKISSLYAELSSTKSSLSDAQNAIAELRALIDIRQRREEKLRLKLKKIEALNKHAISVVSDTDEQNMDVKIFHAPA